MQKQRYLWSVFNNKPKKNKNINDKLLIWDADYHYNHTQNSTEKCLIIDFVPHHKLCGFFRACRNFSNFFLQQHSIKIQNLVVNGLKFDTLKYDNNIQNFPVRHEAKQKQMILNLYKARVICFGGDKSFNNTSQEHIEIGNVANH